LAVTSVIDYLFCGLITTSRWQSCWES